MITKKTYICEVCGRNDFLNLNECREHEAKHSVQEWLVAFPEARICPDCNGKGKLNNENWNICYTCGGTKVIFPSKDTDNHNNHTQILS